MGQAAPREDGFQNNTPKETKVLQIAGFTERMRKAELNKTIEKMTKSGWQLESYHDEGMSKSKATFYRTIELKDAVKPKSIHIRWGFIIDFFFAFFLAAFLSYIGDLFALIVSAALTAWGIHLLVKQKAIKWNKHIIMIAAFTFGITLLVYSSKLKDMETESKYSEAITKAHELIRKNEIPQAIQTLEAALTLGSSKGSDGVQSFKDKLIKATSQQEAIIYLADMKDADLLKFQNQGILPEIRRFNDPDLDKIFTEKITSLKSKAIDLRSAEIKRRNKIAKNAEVERLLKAKEEKKKAVELAEAQALEKQIGRKPENSAWDGSVTPVERFLKANVKDPDSLQFIEWSKVLLFQSGGRNYWAVRVKYRAKNSFGGYVVEQKLALIQHDTVVNLIDY